MSATPSQQQERLDVIANSDEAHATYNTMGELKSVFGATVITSEWDLDIADHVWLATYAVDVVIPEFRKGKLIATSNTRPATPASELTAQTGHLCTGMQKPRLIFG